MKALPCLPRTALLSTLLLTACQSPGPRETWDMHEPWQPPASLARFDLHPDAAPDADLQAALAAADQRIAAELGLSVEQRAFGLLDLNTLRYAAIEPDRMFYGASVPKICIVAGYFEKFPEQVTDLDPAVEDELQRVIKRSDNELAAKYSQIVGLEFLQQWQTSERYHFYDRAHGGGLWSGKHYGVDQPRIGDPLLDHSHGATVRQCLRFYLLLEQDRLVSPGACDRLRTIFAAPRLEFHDDGFVRGLRGRAVTLIRKSGEWEDWHLDTARVRHGERVYLLAGMTHHPRGDAYLQQMAAAADELLCGPTPPPPYVHRTLLHESAADFRLGQAEGAQPEGDALLLGCCGNPGGTYTSPVIDSPIWFNEVVPSWNVATPAGAGFVVELRVGRGFDDSWSPWLRVGDWGDSAALAAELPTDAPPEGAPPAAAFAGRVDVDYFRATERFDRVQYRIRATRGAALGVLRLERFGLCLSDTTGLPLAIDTPPQDPTEAHLPAAGGDWRRRLDVPFRSQKTERPEIAGRICSPTSVAMVLASLGLEHPTGEVAEACYDPLHGIYGNWPRNVQAAHALGARGYLTRFSDWAAVERMIAAGSPLILSVRVEQPGALRNAPYRTTDGHLIVLRGFSAAGDALVNDPAVSDPASGERVYHRADLEQAWMRGSGGVTYVLQPPR